MSRPRTAAGHALAACVGVAIGSLVGFGIGSALGRPEPAPEPPRPPGYAASETEIRSTGGKAESETPAARLLLAWASGGLPATAESAVERIGGVRRATTVRAGVDWLTTEATGDGAIPLEAAIIEPREYARFVAPPMRRTVRSLHETAALVADSSPGERAASARLRLVDRELRVAGAADEIATNGYELLLAGRTPASWSRVDRFILIQLRDPNARVVVERRLREMLNPGQSLRVRAKGETPFLRHGDAVLPQLLIKKTFGEFSTVRLGDGRLEVDPVWVKAHIRSAKVPLLGRVTCHRALLPQLIDALNEVRAEGLGHSVNPRDYGGCFSPRFIGLDPGGRLSHHTWGIAIDINVSENSFGTKPDLDPRLVTIMEQHGLTWGGRWLVPDGMHFEWVEFP